MYIHLGHNKAVTTNGIIGIFDIDNTSVSRHTRDFLNRCQNNGELITLSDELPRSFVLCCERMGASRVYLSGISSRTLAERADNKLK